MKRITRSAIVEHSAERMFTLVDDVESYPRFLPWCRAAKVEERTAVSVQATLSVGMRGLRQTFSTRNELHPPEAMEMRLVKGPFRHFAAAWRFKPLSAQACAVEFSLEYEMAGPLARILEPLFDHIADTMVDAFTRRAGELYGKS
ncbi:MAG TPA: type II toxin-antitoxin system RatA family toxin [Burkholderiales bacterium]|jgi:ribosome-associated toxin RatA of RatAB toxin-antitoxin module|nr:type II toxin-antitoxin system RatA family toxin [Burkholderiales bacterium]